MNTSRKNTLEGVCEACHLTMDEVLRLTCHDFCELSYKKMKNGPLPHMFLLNAWRKAQKEAGINTVLPTKASKKGSDCVVSTTKTILAETREKQTTATMTEAATTPKKNNDQVAAVSPETSLSNSTKNFIKQTDAETDWLDAFNPRTAIWRLRNMARSEEDARLCAQQDQVAMRSDWGGNLLRKFMQMKRGDIVCLVVTHDFGKKFNNKTVLFGILAGGRARETTDRSHLTRSIDWFWHAPMRDLPRQTTNS